MRVTVPNAPLLLNDHPSRLEGNLSEIFSVLASPDVETTLLLAYVMDIQDKFRIDPRSIGNVGFSLFGQAAVNAGIAKTAITIAKSACTYELYVTASCWLFQVVCQLLESGTLQERRRLVKELLQNGLLAVCHDKLVSRFCICRESIVTTLFASATHGLLGEHLSSLETSKILIKLCEYTLAGPDFFVMQFGSPDTTWQTGVASGDMITMPITEAAKYAHRFYALSQERAMWTVHALLCRSPPPSPAFTLSVLEHDTKLIDLLFKCAALERKPWYPETSVSSWATEGIALLFHPPRELVPGVATSPNGLLPKDKDPDWKELVPCLKILVSRPNWVGMITSVWKMFQTESRQHLKTLMKEPLKYHAEAAPGENELAKIFEFRGITRTCIFRIICTLTHVADECGISTADLVSLLPITHTGFSRFKPLNDSNISTAISDEVYTYVEHTTEVFRPSLHTVFTRTKDDPPIQIPSQIIMGPTAFFRILVVLARRGVTSNTVSNWVKQPENTTRSDVKLADIKKIMDFDSLRRLLVQACQRVTAHRQNGHKHIQEKEPVHAGFAYSSAAELAAAIIEFDLQMEGWKCGVDENLIKEVKKELVLNLGNAAEMTLGLKQYKKALSFALGANVAAMGGDIVDAGIVAKNQRRIERARSGLSC